MPNVPLCALVHDTDRLDSRVLAVSARACFADIRVVLARHGFCRAASALQLAAMALEDDLDDIAFPLTGQESAGECGLSGISPFAGGNKTATLV
jgi:hypothetical protein